MNILALDLSLTSTGVADSTGVRTYCPKAKGGPERIAEIRDALYTTCCVGGADVVVIEGQSYGSRDRYHCEKAGLHWVLYVHLHEGGFPYVEVAPTCLKVFATGKGNASKEAVYGAAIRRLGYQGDSYDEADALCLYHMAEVAYGQASCLMPQSHQKAIGKVAWPMLKEADS